MTFLKNIINTLKDNQDYLDAERALKQAEDNINRISMIFPDVSSFDFPLEKNVWVELDESVATGVKTMGIHIGDDYRSMLMHYDTDSFLLPHYHSKEYEVLKVIDGSVKNLCNGEIYERGDVVIIPKNKLHDIVSQKEECYMYILFTEYSEYLKLPHNEVVKSQLTIFKDGVDKIK